MARFKDFNVQIKNPNYLTISHALYEMCLEASRNHHRLPIKQLIALYFSTTTINKLKTNPVYFTAIYQPTKTIVMINDIPWNIYDEYELGLYKLLFSYFTQSSYELAYPNADSLRRRINNFKPLFNKYFEINTRFGINALRQLRLWSLSHEPNNRSKNALQRIFNYKTWVFPEPPQIMDLEDAKSELIRGTGQKAK